VHDCPAALGAWALIPQQQGFTPTFRAVPGGGSLDASVAGDGITEAAPGLLRAGDDPIASWVRAAC
jgi:hypothetical protein